MAKAWKITQDAELIVSRMKMVNLFTNTKTPAKKSSENSICICRLLQIFANII